MILYLRNKLSNEGFYISTTINIFNKENNKWTI